MATILSPARMLPSLSAGESFFTRFTTMPSSSSGGKNAHLLASHTLSRPSSTSPSLTYLLHACHLRRPPLDPDGSLRSVQLAHHQVRNAPLPPHHQPRQHGAVDRYERLVVDAHDSISWLEVPTPFRCPSLLDPLDHDPLLPVRLAEGQPQSMHVVPLHSRLAHPARLRRQRPAIMLGARHDRPMDPRLPSVLEAHIRLTARGAQHELRELLGRHVLHGEAVDGYDDVTLPHAVCRDVGALDPVDGDVACGGGHLEGHPKPDLAALLRARGGGGLTVLRCIEAHLGSALPGRWEDSSLLSARHVDETLLPLPVEDFEAGDRATGTFQHLQDPLLARSWGRHPVDHHHRLVLEQQLAVLQTRV
eukprot:768620-Hanusia_phi.AAC.2